METKLDILAVLLLEAYRRNDKQMIEKYSLKINSKGYDIATELNNRYQVIAIWLYDRLGNELVFR